MSEHVEVLRGLRARAAEWDDDTVNVAALDAAIAALSAPQPPAEAQPDWEVAPPGATHYQPHQDAYYKRVSASEWYVWSREDDRELLRWLLSPGTSDSAEWVVRPTDAHPPPSAPVGVERLLPDDVKWIVNDVAELGVRIGDQCFFLYKGSSLVYEDAKHDDGRPMHIRAVGKREFGECCHPVNHSDYSRPGTVSLDDSDRWEPMPAAPAQQPAAVDDVVDFEIHAGGEYFASVGGPRERAWKEAMHYVSTLSPDDGEPEVFEVTRRKVSLAAQPGGSDNDR